MSKEIKIKLLEYTKRRLMNGGNVGICGAMVNGMWDVEKENIIEFDLLEDIYKDVERDFQKYKPEGVATNQYWWPDFDVIARVNVVNEMIDEYKTLT